MSSKLLSRRNTVPHSKVADKSLDNLNKKINFIRAPSLY
jgi:hypothetical protein